MDREWEQNTKLFPYKIATDEEPKEEAEDTEKAEAELGTEEDVKKLAEESEIKETPDLEKEMQEAIDIPED